MSIAASLVFLSGCAGKPIAEPVSNRPQPLSLQTERPTDYKVDSENFNRSCRIPYEIIVDAKGRMVSYTMDRCGNDVMDQAAERTILQAAPFPPPPNEGASQYTIHGTIIFID
jgi:protein TonB